MTECKGTALIRENIFPELLTIINKADSDHPLLQTPLSLHKEDHTLTQFIIDPTSFNLPQGWRIVGPAAIEIFNVTKKYCFSVDKLRKQTLQLK